MERKYKHLCRPIKIGNVTFRNRGMDGGEHQVRPVVLFMLEQTVSADDKEAAEGQQPDEPGALRPGKGDAGQAEMEEGAYKAYRGSRNGGEDDPFQGDFQLLQVFQEPGCTSFASLQRNK